MGIGDFEEAIDQLVDGLCEKIALVVSSKELDVRFRDELRSCVTLEEDREEITEELREEVSQFLLAKRKKIEISTILNIFPLL